MPKLQIFQYNDFPAIYKWQALAFMRTEWADIFTGSLRWMDETYPPEYDPVHFVVSEGDVLVSNAAVLRLTIPHAGDTFQVYGFGNVFTFPPYRGEGHGRRVVDGASRYIDASDVDVGILFCDQNLEPFYTKSGWESIHDAETRIGTPEKYTLDQELRMMRFVSEKGRLAREAFERQPLYIEWPW